MNNIRKIREMRKLTMKELGKKVGVSESAIGYYETGKREPRYEMCLRIAEALECSYYDLIGLPVNTFQLSSEEETIISLYRKASERDQSLIKQILDAYKEDTSLSASLLNENAG